MSLFCVTLPNRNDISQTMHFKLVSISILKYTIYYKVLKKVHLVNCWNKCFCFMKLIWNGKSHAIANKIFFYFPSPFITVKMELNILAHLVGCQTEKLRVSTFHEIFINSTQNKFVLLPKKKLCFLEIWQTVPEGFFMLCPLFLLFYYLISCI